MKKNLISKLFILILFNCVFLQLRASEDSLFKPTTQEEVLFLRRLAEFWQDGELEIVKFQIENFISAHSGSPLADSLYALLGNIFMNEKDYTKAVSYFDNIKTPETKDKIAINLLSSLYHLKWYQRLIRECDNYEKKADGEIKQKIIFLQALSYFNKSSETIDKTENTKLLNLSKNKFEELINTPFSSQAKEYLSQIHKTFNDYEKASDYFLQLAEQDFAKEDEYLFQAALLQTRFDKEKALNTFNKISQLSSAKSQEASFNKLLLLYEMRRFEEIVKQKETLLQKIAEEKHPLANFFIGRSFFKLNDFENSCLHLENALNLEDKTSRQARLAHIMLMQSAYNLNNHDLFTKAYESFIALFPKDSQIFEVRFAKALLSKNNNKYENAKEEFEKILLSFDKAKENDKFLYEYSHLLFLIGDIENSKAGFAQFAEKYPNHEFIKSSLAHIINCSIKSLQKNTALEDSLGIKKTLVNEIKNLLQHSALFTKKEKSQYKFLLAKTYFDISSYDLCSELSRNLLDEDSLEISTGSEPLLSKEEASEIHLLIGFCGKYSNNNLNEFIHHAQKSLELSENSKNHFLICIHLFNSYLTLSKEKETINENCLEKAANYLFSAYMDSADEISKNNLIWLSNYYHDKVKDYLKISYKNKADADPAILAYCKNASLILKNLIASPDASLEDFSVKLAHLLNAQGNFPEEQAVLENLVKNYRFYPEKPCKYLEESIYGLAKNYENQNKNDKAAALYLEFLSSFKKESPFKDAASLHLARLQLADISKESMLPINKDLEKIISTLKTISLQKNLENEPVHLEAALDYVDIVCYMEKDDNWEKKLFLLGRLKENFYSEDDIVSKDYKNMRNSLKEKDKIFNAYMNVVEAEKFICLGFLEKNNAQLKQAKEILTKMTEDNSIATQYLENRIRKNMKVIEENKFEEK